MTYSHDLPPTITARPLPVTKDSNKRVASAGPKSNKVRNRKRDGESGFNGDDTPKEFARLMRFQALGRFPSGLDDGSKDRRNSKKRKQESNEDVSSATGPVAKAANATEIPRILPGEKMSDFAARVNAALPVLGLAVKGRNNLLGIKERQTRLEKKMQKMQAEWRKEEQRRREKREAEMEDRDEDIWIDDMPATDEHIPRKKKGKRNTTAKSEFDEDPWEQVKRARNEAPRKLHDVVQAPPKLLNRPKQAFGVANGARVDVSEVPKSAGSLRKREELGLARRDVLESYRRMMEGRRGVI